MILSLGSKLAKPGELHTNTTLCQMMGHIVQKCTIAITGGLDTELCLRKLVAGFCQPKPGFHPQQAHVGLLMNQVALRQVSVQVLRFPAVSIVPPVLLHPFRFIHLLLAIQSREL
jgi:hypothetical protein